MKKLLAAIALVAVAAGGVYVGANKDTILPPQVAGLVSGGGKPAPANTAAVATADSPGATAMQPAAQPAGQVVAPAEPREPYVAPVRDDFAFRRMELDTTKEKPEACLVFTKKLQADGSVRYEDYLSWDPAAQTALRVTDDRLCVAGLAFGQRYALTMKSGLPSAEGAKLAADETIPVEMRDKPSTVSFGAGFILPRESADGVPITTVNVDSLDIRVTRVGDRLLSQLRDSIVDERQFWEYDASSYADSQGAQVWSGSMTVANVKNEAVTTAFAIGDALPAMKPGVYLITARNAQKESLGEDEYSYEPDLAGQWIVNTDIALTTFSGPEALTVFVRSFKSALPSSGVKLQLIARNNEILGEATTDGDGRAVFDGGLLRGEGGNAPVVVMAYLNDDFAYIDLRRPGFDLTDRGVDGRDPSGDVDAFLYLDRGIYRPGETVNLTGLLRDRDATAIPTAPVTVKVFKPDGQEFRSFQVADLKAGGFAQAVTLTMSAPRGRWSASAYTDPNGEAVGSIGFDVQDFVPQKLKVTLTGPTGALDLAEPIEIAVESRFLYGAPAAGLGGEGTLTVERDWTPFEKYSAYAFGLVDELFDQQQATLTVPTTDAEGKTTATATLDGMDLSQSTIPLKATADVRIYEPGGRTTGETIVLPVRTRPVMLGIRTDFDYGTVSENTDAGFEVVALDANGAPIAVKGLTYEFVREIVDYRWFQQDGEWRYERNVRDRIVTGAASDVAADAPLKLKQRVEWGSYRLTVADPASGARTSVRFYAGWGWNSASERPDRLNVSADKPAFKAGDTATISVRSPVDGKALMVIAGDRIYDSRLIDVSASGTTVPVEVKKEWGAGVYAMVTLYRPLDAAVKGSARAIGLVHLPIDASDRTLAVEMGTPEKMLPRAPISIPISVANATGDVFVTVAAIDEGVLQITDFKSPDPVKHFFGKRRLGLEIRDDYGRLIETTRFQVGELRTGGDGFGGRGLSVVPQRIVALYSGIVQLQGGKGTVTLDVPDFAGELRVMAVAWSPNAVGFASKPVTVRDPVVAELILPRFLAPGDAASIGLNIHNVEGQAGAYKATISATGPVRSVGAPIEQQLAVGQRELVPVALEATGAGIATIALTVEGPGGFKVDRVWPIEVRAPQMPTSVNEVVEMKPGETYVVPATLLDRFAPGTAEVSLTLSSARGFDDVAGMLRWLDRYPYGCLEQTTSRALPLVYFNDLAKLAGLDESMKIPDRVQEAVYRVLDMQRPDGSFGMWSSGWDSDADRYLQAYATDFLFQAKAKGFVVPEDSMNRALDNMRAVATQTDGTDVTRAYAFYVLARAGKAVPGDVRYFADTAGQTASTALASGFLGGALASIGDRSRAAAAFDRARMLGLEGNPLTYNANDYYGTLLRDVAAVTAVAADVGATEVAVPLVSRIGSFDTSLNYTTTQEKGWMLLAQWRLVANQPKPSVEATGAKANEANGQIVLTPTAAEIGSGVSVRNAGDKSAWRTLSASGVPVAPLPPSANGLTISKEIYNLDGTPANLATMKQNDRVVVVLRGGMRDHARRDMAIVDMLPAGWEIEGPVRMTESGGTVYPWLPEVSYPQVQEARDDRFVVGFGVGSSYRMSAEEEARTPLPAFTFAYVARATTAGAYVVPGAFIEDMYAPTITGRTAMSSTTIAAQ